MDFRKHVGPVLGEYFRLDHTVSRKKLFRCHTTNDQTGVYTNFIDGLYTSLLLKLNYFYY